ncbi:MAG: Fe-S cluster assembly ATPase SufC, partial [Candidatus Geothermarchaeales archaeon]
MKAALTIKDLRVGVEDKEILKGADLTVRQGEIHALMGPNGSGKSTLAYALMGHPTYAVLGGSAHLDGVNLLEMPPDERAKNGLFLAFQYPVSVSGLSIFNFLRSSYNAAKQLKRPISPLEFREMLKEKLELLQMDQSFATRYLNEGFSGGEKKRCEILQLAVLEPSFAIMDETDSGLDIDALKVVANGVNKLAGPDLGILLITHYQRILRYIKPDRVHVMIDGRIVASGDSELAEKLEEKGYDWVRRE